MAEKTVFENGRISDFEGLVTLTLGLVILRTILSCINHRPLPTSQIFIEIEETFCGRTDVRTYVCLLVHPAWKREFTILVEYKKLTAYC